MSHLLETVCDPATTTESRADGEAVHPFDNPSIVDSGRIRDWTDVDDWNQPFALPEPFPMCCLPGAVSDYVQRRSRDIDSDETAIALPVLSALASAIGRSYRIRLKSTWTEPAVIWTAVVTEPGSCKRPPLEAAVEPLLRRQADGWRNQQRAMPQYERDLALYRLEKRRSRGEESARGLCRSTGSEPLPAAGDEFPIRDRKGSAPFDGQNPPPVPTADRLVVNDWNVRSLLRQICRQARSPVVCCEELDGWLARAQTSTNLAHWYDLHAGQSVVIERASAVCPLFAPDPAVSLTGTLSLEVLTKKLLKPNGSDGLRSRLLFAMPAFPAGNWTNDNEDAITAASAGYSAVINRLADLQEQNPCPTMGSDSFRSCGDKSTGSRWRGSDPFVGPSPREPATMELTRAARQSLEQFITDFGRQRIDVPDELADTFMHLQGYAARLALVLHLTRWASGEAVDPDCCDATSMQRGITLANWFGNEMLRVHARISAAEQTRDRGKLLEWVHRRGRCATARDLCRSNVKKYRTTAAAEAALQELADDGLAVWIDLPTSQKGGRPTRILTTNPEIMRERHGGTENSGPTAERHEGGFVGRNCESLQSMVETRETCDQEFPQYQETEQEPLADQWVERQEEGFVGRKSEETSSTSDNCDWKELLDLIDQAAGFVGQPAHRPSASSEQRRSRKKASRQARRKGRRKVGV